MTRALRSVWVGLGIFLCAGFQDGTTAATVHVPSEYATVNAGLDAAAPGDTVLVAPGTHATAEERLIDFGFGQFPVFAIAFLKDGVVLKSEAGPEATSLDLQGQSGVDPQVSNWVLLAALLPSQTTVLDGFTVTGSPLGWNGMWIFECGKMTVRDCIFRDLDASSFAYSGGGIACGAGGLVLERTVFRNCHAVVGGAVNYYEGDSPIQGDIYVDACTFENCSQRALDIAGDDRFPTRVATVRNSVFRGNSSNVGGGALVLHDYTSTVEGCSFFDNLSSPGSGGGVSLFCNFTIRNCLFLRNAVIGNAAGGAVRASPAAGGSGSIQGCTFYGNSQQLTSLGGATTFLSVAPGGGSFNLDNNIIAASEGPAAVHLSSGSLTSSCNVFWTNAAGNTTGFALDVTDRIVDPMFCDISVDDFTLHEASPCLPVNSLGCGQIGAFGQGCGSVSIEATTWAKIKVMYR